MGRNSKAGREDLGFVNIPTLEAHLRAYIEAGDAPNALTCFEGLLRRRRTPQQATCTALLMLCVMQAPRSAMYVLESMGERTLEVDDFNRVVRLFLRTSPEAERLAQFQETAIDLLSFSDDSMHNYFAHLATLLNIELHETLTTGRDSNSDVSLITHKRQTDAIAYLCKKGPMATPVASLLLAGMGGREGAQNEAEMVQLSTAPTGLATEDAMVNARALMTQMQMNESQRLAVEAAMTRRLTLVQGPPGTGKTTVAVSILTLWVRALGRRPVLASADSNVAVDNMGAGLLAAGLNVVRLGRAEAVRPDMHSRMPDALGGNSAIAAADVVLATCVGSGGDSLSKLIFEMVLIDETAQSTEPSCLVPLTHGCRQLVLVGDHRQLRPTVVSEDAARRGLTLSLFERMVRYGVAPLMLDTQYRMHRSLAEFVSDRFYRSKLHSGTSDGARPLPRGLPWPRLDCSAALVVSTAAEEGMGESKRNPGEALLIAALLRSALCANELRPSDIGVVTPYAAQVALLRQHAASLPGGSAVEVMTVDGFQGREKELILFSAVRCNRAGHLGFVSDARRLNVMLTRARRGLVVVGDPFTLVYSRHWADWLAWIQNKQAVLSAGAQAGIPPGGGQGGMPLWGAQGGILPGYQSAPQLGGASFTALPGWRMPARPPRNSRDRSPSSDVDEAGRRRVWGNEDSGSDEEKKKPSFGAGAVSRRERRRLERESRREAGESARTSAEEEWKEQLRALQRERDEAVEIDQGDVLPPPPDDGENWLAMLSATPAASDTPAEDTAAAPALTDGGTPVVTLACTLAAAAAGMAARASIGLGTAVEEEEEEEEDCDDAVKVQQRREAGRLVRQRLASGPRPPREVEPAPFLRKVKMEATGRPVDDGPLLPNWREVRDEASGRVYYYCTMTGEACFQRPSLWL